MKRECFAFFEIKILNIMDMDKPIKRRGYDIVEIWIVLNLCNPTSVHELLYALYSLFFLLENNRFGLASSLSCIVQEHLVLSSLPCLLLFSVHLLLV